MSVVDLWKLPRRPPICPICGAAGSRALLGIFPVCICLDEECCCVWGRLSGLALWLSAWMSPGDGWLFMTYIGSYFGALRESLRGSGNHDRQ